MKFLPALKFLLCVVAIVSGVETALAGQSMVELTRKGDTVVVTIGGREFAVYNSSKSMPKPYFSPVRGPDGTVMTRPIFNKKGEGDHKHHKGIWVSVDEVNDSKHWAERNRIENVSVELLASSGNPAKMRVVNNWLDGNGQTSVTETTTISIHANQLLAYDISFTAGDKQVTFDDTKEGLLGFRMVGSMRERAGGHVVNSKGMEGSDASWGKSWEWIDYYGPIDGKTFGVAIFDHPLNFRPSRYHVRNYGLFSISPFGEKAYTRGKRPAEPVILLAGDTLRLRYAMYLHAGDTEAADVAGVYRAYLKSGE